MPFYKNGILFLKRDHLIVFKYLGEYIHLHILVLFSGDKIGWHKKLRYSIYLSWISIKKSCNIKVPAVYFFAHALKTPGAVDMFLMTQQVETANLFFLK